jgi:hypothetical protein
MNIEIGVHKKTTGPTDPTPPQKTGITIFQYTATEYEKNKKRLFYDFAFP